MSENKDSTSEFHDHGPKRNIAKETYERWLKGDTPWHAVEDAAFLAQNQTPKPSSNELFRAKFLAAIDGLGSDNELAAACKVSHLTIQRWKRGDSQPHRLMQQSVFNELEKLRRSK